MKIGFVGLGLIGGSMAKRIKRNHPEYEILAYSRTRSRLESALNDGAIDEICEHLDEKLGCCDILLFATPVETIVRQLSEIKPYLSKDCIITDVGSTKGTILKAIRDLGLTRQFVGGHPMAGSEKTGYENADESLYENACYVLAPTEDTPDRYVRLMEELVRELGAKPVILNCEEHDYAVAAISHIPHLIAGSLVNMVKDNDTSGVMKKLAASGFKSVTRIASSSPEVWEQICMTNRKAIAHYLKIYINDLQTVLSDIESGNGAGINELFKSARSYRDDM